MYIELSKKEQELIDLVKSDSESLADTFARIEAAFLFQCQRDSESPEELLLMVSSGEVIYQGSR